MKKRLLKVWLLFGMLLCLTVGSISAEAVTLGGGSMSYRLNVLTAIGIGDASLSDELCTRANFARMLVLSSSYKDTSETTITSAAANDVPATYSGAQYIKTALTNGWMRTRLGGTFAPEEAVTLNDAARATLLILGYTDDDFSSNISQERLSLFKSLELNEGLTATEGTDTLTVSDALNVIYNLLRTTPKDSSSIYGTAIDLTLDDDGELNATDVIEDKMVGPLLIKSVNTFLYNTFPFDVSEASYYYNGTATYYGQTYIEHHLESQGWIIIYYNEGSKTVWAYGSDTGNNTYHVVSGKVTSIMYDNDNIASPSSVYIAGTEYTLNSSDVKFMFSLNGSIKVGDYCVLVCKENSNEDEDITDYYAIAAIKWTDSTDSGKSNVIYDITAEKYKTTNSDVQESEETL